MEIEATTQVAGYDGICSEYGHAETINGADCFILDEGAPLAAWKDALSKHKWVTNDSVLFYTTTQYKGHTVLVPESDQGYGDEDMDAQDGSDSLRYLCGYYTIDEEGEIHGLPGSPFTYDMDLNIVCSDLDWSDFPTITDQKFRDGVTWYKYHIWEDYEYWLPEHNGADWEQVYKKYVEEPYNAKRNSMSEEEKVNEDLIYDEQVWNKTYYNIFVDTQSARIVVSKKYAYKNADGSITQSAGWENCDSSIFDGTSLTDTEEGSVVRLYPPDHEEDAFWCWRLEGDALYKANLGYGRFVEFASELYYHLIDLYCEECVYWNKDGGYNNSSETGHWLEGGIFQYDGKHDWDPYSDGKDRCKSTEEHIAKCQGN